MRLENHGNDPQPQTGAILTLQALFLAFAAVCIFYGQHNFAIRSVGLLAIFVGLVLVRNSSLSSQAIRGHNRPAFFIKPWQWLVGLVLVVVLAAAVAWLFYDASTSYGSGTAPIYAFIAATLFCSLWWGAIFMRWLNW